MDKTNEIVATILTEAGYSDLDPGEKTNRQTWETWGFARHQKQFPELASVFELFNVKRTPYNLIAHVNNSFVNVLNDSKEGIEKQLFTYRLIRDSHAENRDIYAEKLKKEMKKQSPSKGKIDKYKKLIEYYEKSVKQQQAFIAKSKKKIVSAKPLKPLFLKWLKNDMESLKFLYAVHGPEKIDEVLRR